MINFLFFAIGVTTGAILCAIGFVCYGNRVIRHLLKAISDAQVKEIEATKAEIARCKSELN